MTFTKQTIRRSVLALALSAGLGIPLFSRAEGPADSTTLAQADELKSKAFAALKAGKFDVTNEYLAKAAEIDPKLKEISDWTKQFEAQRKEFTDERHKEYDKAYNDVQLLLKNHKESYAIDAASRAYVLSDNKKDFAKIAWVSDLIKQTSEMGKKYEADEQWLKAMRVYSDLSAVEPSVPEWKDLLKVATRRIRLLAIYSPDALKGVQEAEAKDREEVDALLKPTTKPAKPATKPGEENQFKTDWKDTLKGVQMQMLRQSLEYANDNYYRDVSYKQLAIGGIKALRVVATTKGLETTFPNLGTDTKKAEFVKYLDDTLANLKAAKVEEGIDLLRKIIGNPRSADNAVLLGDLRVANKKSVELPEEVLISEFADGAFGELDPFSNVIWPTDLEEFKKQTKGEFSGVGIQIQSDEDGSLKVVSPLEDSPAFKAGIKAGDIVTHINGKVAKGITLNQAVKQITGPPHTEVSLTIRSSDGTSRDVKLDRQTIKVASIKGWMRDAEAGGWNYWLDPQQKIGYIRLTNFTETTSTDLTAALKVMKAGDKDGVRGFILDLRYDPGGLLSAATEVCDKFIKDGIIVSTHPDRPTANQASQMDADPNHDKVEVPMIVLVNQYSASASEIVSGALKDHHRALIVGERTFGKGSVQMLFPLAERSAFLKLTTSHYYLPSGRCLHREENSTEWGVDPDVTVDMTPEQMRGAIDSRQESDILREKGQLPVKPEAVENAVGKVKKYKDPLQADEQLSAALLLMRLELNGAPSLTATASR